MPSNPTALTRALMLGLAVAVAGCSRNPSPQETQAQPAGLTSETAVVVPNELATVRPGYVAAWSGTDPMAFRTYISENAVVITPSDRFTGWNDIRTRWLAPTLTGMTNYMVTPTSFTREGNDIIESGHYTYRVTHAGGHTENRTTAYSYRWQRQPDGTWRIVGVSVR